MCYKEIWGKNTKPKTEVALFEASLIVYGCRSTSQPSKTHAWSDFGGCIIHLLSIAFTISVYLKCFVPDLYMNNLGLESQKSLKR